MCGIAGQVAFGDRADPAAVAAMIARIRHRGPDDEGVWSSPDGACALGHARLSIIDLTPSGHQPMIDPETGNSIVFNGEIYNYLELKAECEARGDRFQSESDTEVILYLYRRYGVDCLHKLRGMFAFAIWDEGARELFVARDRVGKKPFLYAVSEGRFVFCSEMSGVVAHPWVGSEIDHQALELYLQLQYVPAPWTIFEAVRKLPPAHYAVFSQNGFLVKKYWDIDYRQKVSLSEGDALDGLEERLTEATRLRLISDVPLGALLSGGVDSSLVVALMSRISSQPVRTFSIGFREEAFNELPYAQQVADQYGALHHPEVLEEDVEGMLSLLVRHYGEPYADSSALPSFLVSQAARRHVTVVLNGDGGDELLGGYPRYSLSRLQLAVSSLASDLLPVSGLVSLAGRVAAGRGLHGKIARKLATGFAWPELRSVNMYGNFWTDEARAELMGDRHDPALLPAWRKEWLRGAREHANNPVDRMLWYDSHTYLPGDLLAKMDIASMHCGLETRSPLLDHEVIEFCAALDPSMKVRGPTGKYLLKKLAERYFPNDFVHRKKMGFAIPLRKWLSGPLRDVVQATLRDERLMEPLNIAVIERTLVEFFDLGEDHSSRVWALLMYGLWRREFMVLPGTQAGRPV